MASSTAGVLRRAGCALGTRTTMNIPVSIRVLPNRLARKPLNVLQALQQPSPQDSFRDFDGRYGSGQSSPIPEPSRELLADLTPAEQLTVRLFNDNSPSVVNIATSANLAPMFPVDALRVPRGVGSGFVWDRDGHVCTNAHVVANADAVQVTLFDGTSYKAKVIGKDREKDIAVLQLDMPKQRMRQLRPVVLGCSSNLLVGQRVYAIGNAFGLQQTLTQGIVSGVGRELPLSATGAPITNVIQHDSTLNPGNSGGVLLDTKGRLVGINTAILDPTGAGISSGVGFAIPIDAAKGLVEQILKYGRTVRPAMGISLAPPQIVQQNKTEGLLVLSVAPNGPAARAGMRATTRDMFGRLVMGDIITAVNDTKIRAQKDLFAVLDACQPGQEVEVVVQRGQYSKTLKVILVDRNSTAAE